MFFISYYFRVQSIWWMALAVPMLPEPSGKVLGIGIGGVCRSAKGGGGGILRLAYDVTCARVQYGKRGVDS